jgi:hypothetical protein
MFGAMSDFFSEQCVPEFDAFHRGWCCSGRPGCCRRVFPTPIPAGDHGGGERATLLHEQHLLVQRALADESAKVPNLVTKSK